MSILENIPWALEENVYPVVLGCCAQKISIKSIWFNVSFKTVVSFLICLEDLSIDVNGVLEFPAMILLLLIFSLRPSMFTFYTEVLLFWVHKFMQGLFLLVLLIPLPLCNGFHCLLL